MGVWAVFPNVEVRHLHAVDIFAEELNFAGVLFLLIFLHSARAFSKAVFLPAALPVKGSAMNPD
jgi:hypothetical protein